MRVISYNILEGGVGRADPIAEVLLARRPDVVGLVEADDAEVVARIAWRLGMDHAAAVGAKGRTSALLTRGRIVTSTNAAMVNAAMVKEGGPRSFLWAEVEVDGAAMPVGVVHLSAKASDERERRREAELDVVLDVTREPRDAGRPHLLMGDFNANSPVQRLARASLPDKSRPHWDANGGDLPRRAVAKLLEAGYVDALAAHDPEAAATAASFTTRQPGQRVDYVFAHGLRVVDAWVERDRLAEYASDHFPVGAEVTA